MQKWYDDTTKAQKILMFIVSILLVIVYFIGVIPLVLLLYLELGSKAYK